MNKPIKPNITIPESFAKNGVKTDFDSDLIASGFDDLKPDVLAGDNLNKFIDDTYQGLNYGMAAADAINLINEGETLTVVDGKLTSGASGGGLEIGDIGIAPLGIDETKGKRRYINGQVIIQEQFVQFTNKVKKAVELYPSLACTEEEWQTTATMTVGGQVGKFVIDDEAGTIRLPRIIMPIQNLTDLNSLAEIVEAGLPNIEGSLGKRLASNATGSSPSATGAFSSSSGNSDADGSGTGRTGIMLKFSASDSNSIYGNSTTVQQEQIQYPYFIQVATGSETEDNIINEIELNNPFSLLDYKFSEYELNNISWLRSNNQFNSKAIYPAVYDLLLKIYNGTETKAGVSVKLFGEEYTDYDFVLNTAEETFRLPVKVKLASGKAIAGNGMTLGVTDGIKYAGLDYTSDHGVNASTSLYGQPVKTQATSNPLSFSKSIGLTTDSTKSGIETSDNGLYLYFYVGETVQNANLINAGRIEEKLSNKININSGYVDGQWVGKVATLTQSVAAGTTTIDMSEYLPNDDYDYEVLLKCSIGDSAGNSFRIYSDIVAQGSLAFNTGGNGYYIGTFINMLVGKERVVYQYLKESGSSAAERGIEALAYRRIGKNK